MATVHLSAMEPIGVSKTAKQLWSDTYITIRFRPNRKSNYGPTFISMSALDRDIEHEKWAIDFYGNCNIDEYNAKKEKVFSKSLLELFGDTTEEDLKNLVNDSLKSLSELMLIKKLLCDSPYVIMPMKDANIPNIYTSAELLDRQEVESMVRFWLDYKGHKYGRLKWKRQTFIVTPS